MPYPARFMYEVVNDVSHYADFLPWCGDVEIHHVSETSMEASILMRGAGLNHWFKTRNVMQPGVSIDMALVEGPFNSLDGTWRFIPLNSDGCKVELVLQYELKQGLARAIIAPAFSSIANSMVASFCERATELYEQQNAD